MKIKSKILFTVILSSVFIYAYLSSGYIPDQKLVFAQVVSNNTAAQNENIEVGLFIKNYFNYTITNITVSLNFSQSAPFTFNSSLFGQLTNGNVTLNSTIQSPSEYYFTAVNITYGFMTKDYLEYNITKIDPNISMIFYFNVTSDTIIERTISAARLSYYDNWGDLQDIQSQSNVLLNFISAEPEIDPDLPQWDLGKEIPTTWAWVIFALVPAVTAGLSAFLFYFKRR